VDKNEGINLRFFHFLIASTLNILFGAGMVYLRDVRGAFFLLGLACIAHASTWSIYFLLENNVQAKNTTIIWSIIFLIFIFFSISLLITWKSSKGRKQRKKLGFKKNSIFILCSFFAYYGVSFISAGQSGFGFVVSYTQSASSMAPTLLSGDYFLSTKVNRLDELSRGDIVVFFPYGKTDKPFVKRIIGLPGDQIQIISGILNINGNRVKRDVKGVAKVTNRNDEITFTVYEEIFQNGHSHLIQERSDNEPFDSTPLYKIPDGHYFLMGDNRDNSRDSRTTSIGLVPGDNILGKAKLIYFNSKKGISSERIGMALK